MGFTTISSTQLAASGAVFGGSARIKDIWIAHSATAGIFLNQVFVVPVHQDLTLPLLVE